MKKTFSFSAFALAIATLTPLATQAEVKLPSIFSDHMVIQRDQAVPVWGWADPGESVSVTFGEHKATTKANPSGRWQVDLPAMPANTTGTDLTIRGQNTHKFEDVLVGEVWLCSGQSNMEWTVNRSGNAKEEIAKANDPRIRHIKIKHHPAKEPQTDVPSPGWQVASPETVGSFSAVGYYFARHLIENLDVPVGLIGSNWGGTRIEPWTAPSGFAAVPALSDIHDKIDRFPSMKKKKKAKDSDEMIEVVNHQSPLALYNGMIHPLVPYAICGAIWYQGESNNGEGMLYHEKMKALIHGWRKVWNKPEMPFYYVQLAPYQYGGNRNEKLPGIWQAQLKTLDIPHTGMAVITDIGNPKNIHPKNKQDVGKRLALWALAKTYSQDDLIYSGPLFRQHHITDGKIRVEFDMTGQGLKSRDGKPLTHFEIAGADGTFHPATANIKGDHLILHSEAVKNPKHVRFAWDQVANPNLVNSADLPASPFTTSDF